MKIDLQHLKEAGDLGEDDEAYHYLMNSKRKLKRKSKNQHFYIRNLKDLEKMERNLDFVKGLNEMNQEAYNHLKNDLDTK